MLVEQPDAPNQPTKSATPLERAIYEYQLKADEFHKKELASKTATGADKEQLLKEWREARVYLDQMRMKIDTLAALEDGLAKYRDEFGILDSEERLLAMRSEKYHPTHVLRNNLIADSDPPPTPKHNPHHIVMGKGRWRKREMTRVRLKMFDVGIRINDSKNGVWLHPDKCDHWATPDSPIHNPLHGYNYETWVIGRLQLTLSNEEFERNLKGLKSALKTDTWPKKILEPKDANWSGV